MSPAELVGTLRQRGVLLVPAADGRLRFRPSTAVSVTERSLLDREREAVLALLEADPVGWRAAVMASQIRPGHAYPLLVARPGIRFPLGSCCSCGDPLGTTDHYRCTSCAVAVTDVLALVDSATHAT